MVRESEKESQTDESKSRAQDATRATTSAEPEAGTGFDNSGAQRLQRARRTPKWYGVMLMMCLLVVNKCLPDNHGVDTRPRQSFMTEGVVFRQKSSVGFSDSEWVIVADVSLQPLFTTLDYIERWMKNGTGELAGVFRSRDVDSDRLFKSTTSRTNRRLLTIFSMRERLAVLNDAIYSPGRLRRDRRSLINVGDTLLHYLFGTATDEFLQELSKKLELVGTETTGIIHVLSEQASLVNETLLEIQTHATLLRKLHEAQ